MKKATSKRTNKRRSKMLDRTITRMRGHAILSIVQLKVYALYCLDDEVFYG
jgi:hypothetical protein